MNTQKKKYINDLTKTNHAHIQSATINLDVYAFESVETS